MTKHDVGRLPVTLALSALLATLLILVSSQSARAESWTAYCSNVLLQGNNTGGGFICEGNVRVMHAVYGWGDQHSVCVWGPPGIKARCSAGPEEGVYDPLPESSEFVNISGHPGISNNAHGTNRVHGLSQEL